MITGLAHINLLVPEGTLPEANEFYCETLGLKAAPVPQAQVETTAW
jgi:catechol 2,3-dioxygenase-like lactoylglutathione lyase family enzyme